MTEKDLLWWIFKLIDYRFEKGYDLDHLEYIDAEYFEQINAPDWVGPAFQERYRAFKSKTT